MAEGKLKPKDDEQDDGKLGDQTQVIEGEEDTGDEVIVITEEARRAAKEEKEGGEEEGEGEGEEEGEEEGEGVAAGEAGEDDRAKKRRDKRKRAKERVQEREREKDNQIDSLRSEVQRLSDAQAKNERRTFGADAERVDNAIAAARNQMAEASRIIEQGVAAQNGKAVAQAQQAYVNARDHYNHYVGVKRNMAVAQNQPPPMDPQTARLARNWVSDNAWYDPNGGDRDSRRALRIDQELHEEGLNPRTPGYWKEFDRRVKKELPHVFETDDDKDEKDGKGGEGHRSGGSITTGSGREGVPEGTKGVYRISSARVAALKEAGMWEQFNSDGKFRTRMVKRYRDQDAQNPRR
jgi:hypothetical protein